MISILKFIWQLPQNLIALFILLINCRNYTKEEIEGVKVYFLKYGMFGCGVSLGNFILLSTIYKNPEYRYALPDTAKHEHGHQIQSLYLGFLYLIVVGIPSVCNNIWSRIAKKDHKWYYSRYPENWADKLGKVERTY